MSAAVSLRSLPTNKSCIIAVGKHAHQKASEQIKDWKLNIAGDIVYCIRKEHIG
jgi:hypothetical protein